MHSRLAFSYIGVCIILVQGGLVNTALRRFDEVGALGFGAKLLVIGQILTVVMAMGSISGNGLQLIQMLIVTTTMWFGFGFCNPAHSAPASNLAGKTSIGGALGMVQGFGSLGYVGGLILAPPPGCISWAGHIIHPALGL